MDAWEVKNRDHAISLCRKAPNWDSCQVFHVEVVGVGEEADQRHGVVRFVLDVDEHEDAGFFGGQNVATDQPE